MLKEMVQAQTAGLNRETLDSREVAEMLEKEHAMLLREIDGSKDGKTVGIIPTLENAKFAVSDYFVESSYKSGTRDYKSYLITKMGCELIGNKQQGAKGILFTAKYVKRFNQMEEVLKDQQPTCIEDVLIASLKEMKEVKNKIQEVEAKQIETKEEIQGIRDMVALNPNQWREDTSSIINKISNKLGGCEHISPIRREIYKLLDNTYGVKLETRLLNKKKKMALEGTPKYKIDKINLLDVIAEDKKLINGYVNIVAKLAIKYGV